MKRTAIGLCAAAAFGFVAAGGAQTPPTTTAGQTPAASSRDAKDIAITGCLQRGPDGKFILTNARMENDMTHSSSTGTTTGSTAGTTGSTAGTTTSAAGSTTGAMDPANTWTLEGGKDLDKHVGHKVQVTGRAMDATHKDDDAAKGATSSATGSTATTGTTGTTGATAPGGQRHEMQTGSQRLDVKAVKMIAASCP
jgi:hypothetical protein